MDIFSHGLWGGVIAGRKNRANYLWAVFFGLLPDIFSFGLFFVLGLFNLVETPNWQAGPPAMEIIPSFVHSLYNFTHSLVVFLLIFLFVWLLKKKPFWTMIAWAIHILIDIPTHSIDFFATPFLWPISNYRFSGISWSNPFIFYGNLSLLFLAYLMWFVWWKNKKNNLIKNNIMKSYQIIINEKKIRAEKGETILSVAIKNGIEIPTLCFDQDIKKDFHCGMCLVKIKGENDPVLACQTLVQDGLEVVTEDSELLTLRKKNLDKILANHLLECDDCVWFQHCKLLDLVKKFSAKPVAVKNENDKVWQVGKMVFDQTKCIGCGNCLAVCPTKFLSLDEREKVEVSENKNKDCVNCGQCILHCPVGAIEAVGEYEGLSTVLADKNYRKVVQFAPALRVSIGEEFGIPIGEISTGKLVAGLRKIGFDYVFDTAVGADFTTFEEAQELAERILTNKNLPAMSSCCPAWVKYLEFSWPKFLPNLCTSRSPQTMLGAIIKNYWAKQKGLKAEEIKVFSIMPCVAKKEEIKREELKVSDLFPVDEVLTTRELVRLFKINKIDFRNLPEELVDNPLGDSSGAGVIYGASGGVFESALRTAYFNLTGKDFVDFSIKKIRGNKGIKTTEIKIGDKTLKVVVVSGLKNAEKMLKKLQKDPLLFDAMEVMACPGGCVGGGGQSLPNNKEIIKRRAQGLYLIDQQKKTKGAHQNENLQKVYRDFFTNKEIIKKNLHTSFSQRKKTKIHIIPDSRKTIKDS